MSRTLPGIGVCHLLQHLTPTPAGSRSSGYVLRRSRDHSVSPSHFRSCSLLFPMHPPHGRPLITGPVPCGASLSLSAERKVAVVEALVSGGAGGGTADSSHPGHLPIRREGPTATADGLSIGTIDPAGQTATAYGGRRVREGRQRRRRTYRRDVDPAGQEAATTASSRSAARARGVIGM